MAGGSPGSGTPRRVPFRVRKLRPVPSRPSQPPLCLPGSAAAPDPGAQQGDLLSPVSEGRRDQCEAPSDPKFPDCSGKVEVRPGAAGGGGGDQEGGSSVGAVPKMSSGVPLLVRLPASWGLSAQAADPDLDPRTGWGQGHCCSAWPTNHLQYIFIANKLSNIRHQWPDSQQTQTRAGLSHPPRPSWSDHWD